MAAVGLNNFMFKGRGDLFGAVVMACFFQPAGGLRNPTADHKHKQGRDRQGNEDPAPAYIVQAQVGQNPGADKAQRPEAFQNRDVPTTTFSGHDLRNHGQADGKFHSHAKPQQHPERHQLLDVLGQATGQASYTPKNHTPLKDRFAPVLVCQHARNGSTQKHA